MENEKVENVVGLSNEEIWEKYGKMIMKIAHNISNCYNQDFDEVLSEGILGVYMNLHKFDPTRSNISTYIHQKATFKMLDFCIKPERQIPTEVHSEDGPFLEKEYKQNNWLQNLFEELSEEAHMLINIIIESPEELFNAIKPTRPIRSKTALKNYMVDVLDWNSKEFDNIFSEVAKCL